MSYNDVIIFYKAANICMTRSWNENRIKGNYIKKIEGKFVKIEDLDNPNNTMVLREKIMNRLINNEEY